MKVFISWSGSLSKRIAEILREWLQDVLQNSEPFLSSEDIDKGTIWFNRINNELATSGVGIICLTFENLREPWILFESGALAKGLEQPKICTLLINITPEHVKPPLSMFNATLPERKDMLRLVKTVNAALSEKGLPEARVEKAFTQHWPSFEQKFKEAVESERSAPKPAKRELQDMVEELLAYARSTHQQLTEVTVAPKSPSLSYFLGYKGSPVGLEQHLEQLNALFPLAFDDSLREFLDRREERRKIVAKAAMQMKPVPLPVESLAKVGQNAFNMPDPDLSKNPPAG
jgi:hypothetical protein